MKQPPEKSCTALTSLSRYVVVLLLPCKQRCVAQCSFRLVPLMLALCIALVRIQLPHPPGNIQIQIPPSYSRSTKKRKSYITRTILFAQEVYLCVDIRKILIIHNLVFLAITPMAYLLFARNLQYTTPNIHSVYICKKMV